MTRTSSAAVAAAFGAALFLAASAAALAPAAARADEAKALTEREKIEALIRSVSQLKGAKFVRNGAEFDGKAAADHMRRKWKSGEKEIKTARDFIRLAATKSSSSGKPYLIRFKDGKAVESGTYLLEKLETMEAAPPAG